MKPNNTSVNYIKHLTEVFIQFTEDKRLSPPHISLYMALFQMWNINRFQNPFLIIRSEIMQISKISNKSTYHRCINQLNQYGYIKYIPSRNPMIGSNVEMKDSPILRQVNDIDSPTLRQVERQGSPILRQVTDVDSPILRHPNEPFYKHINNKHINICIEQNEFCKESKNEKVKKEILPSAVSKNVKFIAPTIELVQVYFKEKNKPDIEAQKFFNYFESNGWKIGGRSPMKNWKAAANNWMLNSNKFNPIPNQPKPDNLHTNQDKDYSIPL